jgi:hypothetical protein
MIDMPRHYPIPESRSRRQSIEIVHHPDATSQPIALEEVTP